MSNGNETGYPPLMREQICALQEYAQDHGPDWKERLRKEWATICMQPLLQHLRNTHGPFWLSHFEFSE
jgi:hypothetical protein